MGARLVRLRDRRYGRTRVAVYEAALADGSLASEARGGGGGGDGEGGAAGGGEAAGGGVGQ